MDICPFCTPLEGACICAGLVHWFNAGHYGMRFHFKKKYFRIMLQVFHRDVAKVDLDVVILHVFHTDVASVLSGCCIFIERFRMFHIT